MGPEGLPASKTKDDMMKKLRGKVFENVDEFEKFLENITYKRDARNNMKKRTNKNEQTKETEIVL